MEKYNFCVTIKEKNTGGGNTVKERIRLNRDWLFAEDTFGEGKPTEKLYAHRIGQLEREHLPQGGAVGSGVTGAQQRVGTVQLRRDARIVPAPTAHEQGGEQRQQGERYDRQAFHSKIYCPF